MKFPKYLLLLPLLFVSCEFDDTSVDDVYYSEDVSGEEEEYNYPPDVAGHPGREAQWRRENDIVEDL